MKFLDALSAHRTALLGGTQIAVGAVMTYLPGIQPLVNPVHYGMTAMALGVSTAVLGFVNTRINDRRTGESAYAALTVAGVPPPEAHAALTAVGVKPPQALVLAIAGGGA